MTSASDGVARVWNDKGDIRCIFKTNTSDIFISKDLLVLMKLVSKWSRDGQFIASGG